MIRLRCMSGAILRNGNDFLLLKRNPNREFAPSLWSDVGGHMEPEEIGDPVKTCLREIFEETGIGPEYIHVLKLKYMIMRRSGDEIRIHHIYFGDTDIRQVIDCNEGSLFWVPRGKLLDREMSFTVKTALIHYLANEDSDEIWTGTVAAPDGRPVMHWSALQDWEGMV